MNFHLLIHQTAIRAIKIPFQMRSVRVTVKMNILRMTMVGFLFFVFFVVVFYHCLYKYRIKTGLQMGNVFVPCATILKKYVIH